MLAVRAPFSALGGALLSCVMFVGLAQLVKVPFEIPDRVLVDPVVLKPPRAETPVQTTRDPKVERPPTEAKPGVPGLKTDDPRVRGRPDFYKPPPLEARPRDPASRPRGFDSDVIPVINVRPEYPQRAIAGNIEGWVQVRFTVTAIGTVRDAVVVDSEPSTVFDDAALKAIARWRYNPRVENGEAVERVGLQTMIRFTLEN